MNISNILKILIRIMGVLFLGMLLSIIVAFINHESITPFLKTILVLICTAIPSLFLIRILKPNEVNKKESYFIVSISWFFIVIIGALPFIFTHNFTIVDALFESTSGFTTTGSSIISDVEILPKSILFWRSLTHWIGGIGIILIVILIMPSLKIGAKNLFSLESSVSEKISPKITSVTYRLVFIYISLTILEIIFLIIGGMDIFDSICHSLGTVATGGFSTKNTSIADYSPYIQYVIGVFMLFAGTNFLLYYYLIKGNFEKIRCNEEFWFYLRFILVATLVVTAILFFKSNLPFEKSFRDSFFQVVSIITCTGFASTDYLLWPVSGWIIMFLLLFVGGSTGSTAGGIKMARHVIAYKNIKRVFKHRIHPKAITTITYNNSILSSENNQAVLTFIMLYFVSFFIGTILLIALQVDGKTAASSIATAMAGAGPGIGSVGPMSNFGHLTNSVKLVISFFMILGRLEIYTLLILFTPYFWKSK